MGWLVMGVGTALAALMFGVVSLCAKSRADRSAAFLVGFFFLAASITFFTW